MGMNTAPGVEEGFKMHAEYILVPRAVTPPTEASPELKGHIFSLLCSSPGFTVRKQS